LRDPIEVVRPDLAKNGFSAALDTEKAKAQLGSSQSRGSNARTE
jgi:hypothetical protein